MKLLENKNEKNFDILKRVQELIDKFKK